MCVRGLLVCGRGLLVCGHGYLLCGRCRFCFGGATVFQKQSKNKQLTRVSSLFVSFDMNSGDTPEANALGALVERCASKSFSSLSEARDAIYRYSIAVGRSFFVLRSDKTRLDLCCGQPVPSTTVPKDSDDHFTDETPRATDKSQPTNTTLPAPTIISMQPEPPKTDTPVNPTTAVSRKKRARKKVKFENDQCTFRFTVRLHADKQWHTTSFKEHSCLPLGKPVCCFF